MKCCCLSKQLSKVNEITNNTREDKEQSESGNYDLTWPVEIDEAIICSSIRSSIDNTIRHSMEIMKDRLSLNSEEDILEFEYLKKELMTLFVENNKKLMDEIRQYAYHTDELQNNISRLENNLDCVNKENMKLKQDYAMILTGNKE